MSTFKINPTRYENYIFLKLGELGVCFNDDYEIEIAANFIHDVAVTFVNVIAKDNVNDGLEHKRITELINASIKDIADGVDKAIKAERSKLSLSDKSKLAIINTVYIAVNDACTKLNECMTKTLFNASVTDTSGHERKMIPDDLNKAIDAGTVNEIWKVLSTLKEITDILECQRAETIFDDNCTESSKSETKRAEGKAASAKTETKAEPKNETKTETKAEPKKETSGTSTNNTYSRVKPINYDDIVRATRQAKTINYDDIVRATKQAKNELTELLETFGIFLS